MIWPHRWWRTWHSFGTPIASSIFSNTRFSPAPHQIVSLARTSYQTGNASLLDLLDSQRSLIDIERLSANLRITRDKRLAEIESIAAVDLSASGPS